MVFLAENFFCQLLCDSTGAALFSKSFNGTPQSNRINAGMFIKTNIFRGNQCIDHAF